LGIDTANTQLSGQGDHFHEGILSTQTNVGIQNPDKSFRSPLKGTIVVGTKTQWMFIHADIQLKRPAPRWRNGQRLRHI
jgi:hypothetical protein